MISSNINPTHTPPKPMTKQQALYQFRNVHLGVVKGDTIYTRGNWNNFTDYLCKSGEITTKQYETWSNPF